MALPPTFDARVVAKRMLTPTVVELRFERTDGASFTFEPGQWVNLVLPAPPSAAPPEFRRAYSIASPPLGTPAFELAITKVDGGPGSTYLHAVEVGQELRVVGPQGFFTRAADSVLPSLFVGTGTGITPLRSMIRAALERGNEAPLRLVYGVRREEDLVYREELARLAAAHPQLVIDFTLSREGDAGWPGRRGYVQVHVREHYEELARVAANAGPDGKAQVPHVYICGLQKMVGSVRELLKTELGLPRQQVHSERYD